MRGRPRFIMIVPDDHYVREVGETADGRQFFMTDPFIPASAKDPGREFIALYLFDRDGNLLEARIDDLGTRAELHVEDARTLRIQRLGELGPVRFTPIRVKPFELERFGTTFGLVAEPPEPDIEDDHWWVSVQPGDYIAFTPPWDGRYDT